MNFLLAAFLLFGAASDPVSILLNSPDAVSPRTYSAAVAAVKKAAEEGKPVEQFAISVTTDDKELAERYFKSSERPIMELAAEKDSALAWYLLSMKRQDMRMLRKAATGGCVQALNALGTISVQDALAKSSSLATNEFDRVMRMSFAYFAQAAAMRDSNAYINLGTCYQRGLGCEQDLAMAFECFKAAAEAGNPQGMDYMSACFEYGHGVPKDTMRALYWRERAEKVRSTK